MILQLKKLALALERALSRIPSFLKQIDIAASESVGCAVMSEKKIISR